MGLSAREQGRLYYEYATVPREKDEGIAVKDVSRKNSQ